MFEEILTPLFFTEQGRYLGLAALSVAGLLVCSAVINNFSTWHSDFVLSRNQSMVVSTVNLSDDTARLVAQIPEAHLFGKPPVDADMLPITSLQLHLTGIIKMSQDVMSHAIISQAGQAGKIYSVGDTLSSGIKISAINDDNIVLERAGHLEKLPMTRKSLSFQDRPKSLWTNPT